MKTLINKINDFWPIISIIALLIPTPLALLRKKFNKEIREHVPAKYADLLIRTDWNDIQSVIEHLGTAGGTHDTAVKLICNLTANTRNPLTPEAADWIVLQVERVYAGLILRKSVK